MTKPLFVALVSVLLSTQAVPSSMRAAVVIDEYFGDTYTAAPTDARGYVLFRGEPLRLKLQVMNRRDDVAELTLPSVEGGETFTATVVDAQGQTPLKVKIGAAQLRLQTGGRANIEAKTVALERLQAVEWDAEVLENLPVGEHRIAFSTNVADVTGRRILWQAPEIIIEIRARTGASAEIARREALREFTSGDAAAWQRADAAADRLLKIHPRSYEALLIKSRIAGERGDPKRERELSLRALEILRNDQDELFLKFKGSGEAAAARRRIESSIKK